MIIYHFFYCGQSFIKFVLYFFVFVVINGNWIIFIMGQIIFLKLPLWDHKILHTETLNCSWGSVHAESSGVGGMKEGKKKKKITTIKYVRCV